MANDMSDQEWIDYFRSHCETPRAGFMQSNVNRLFEITGQPAPMIGTGIVSLSPSIVGPWCVKAQFALDAKGK